MRWWRRFQIKKEARVLAVIRDGVPYATEIAEKARVGSGSVYPILARLEQDGIICSDWGWDDNIRRRVYYEREK